MMYWCAAEFVTDLGKHLITFISLLRACTNLDELMGIEREINFLDHGNRESLVTNQYDGTQSMGSASKRAASLTCQANWCV